MKQKAVQAAADTWILYYSGNFPKWYKARKGQIVGYIGTQTPAIKYFPMSDGSRVAHWEFIKPDTSTGVEKEFTVQYIRQTDAVISEKGYIQTDFTGKKVFAINKDVTTNIYGDWLQTSILESFKTSPLSEGFLGRLTGIVYEYPFVMFEVKYGSNLEKTGYLKQPINFNPLAGLPSKESILDAAANATQPIQNLDYSLQQKTDSIGEFFTSSKGLITAAAIGIGLFLIFGKSKNKK